MPFNGKYRKGYMRILKALKREEADARNAKYRAAHLTAEQVLLTEIFTEATDD